MTQHFKAINSLQTEDHNYDQFSPSRSLIDVDRCTLKFIWEDKLTRVRCQLAKTILTMEDQFGGTRLHELRTYCKSTINMKAWNWKELDEQSRIESRNRPKQICPFFLTTKANK